MVLFGKRRTSTFQNINIFWNSLKNHWENRKNLKKNRNFEIFFRKSENFRKSRFFSIRFSIDFFEKNRKFSRFRKKSQNFENFSDFFDFLNEIFMNFKKFWCSGKLKFSSFQKVSCLFTKYAPLALCMAVSEKPCKKTVFHVKSKLLGIEVIKSALNTKQEGVA